MFLGLWLRNYKREDFINKANTFYGPFPTKFDI